MGKVQEEKLPTGRVSRQIQTRKEDDSTVKKSVRERDIRIRGKCPANLGLNPGKGP